MARKPHIAYYADLAYAEYPQQFSMLREILSFARGRRINFLVYSDIERNYFGHPEGWKALATTTGVRVIYTTPSITIYELVY